MIYKLIIGLVLIATVIYYLFCFLEIFGCFLLAIFPAPLLY